MTDDCPAPDSPEAPFGHGDFQLYGDMQVRGDQVVLGPEVVIGLPFTTPLNVSPLP